MLTLQHPPPPYHPHPPPAPPPPRYTISVNVNTIRVLNLAQSGSPPTSLDEKSHLDQRYRQSWDTIPSSPTHLTARDYHDYHDSRRRDSHTMAKPTHRSAVPAPSLRNTVCRWFTRKPSTPCPKFQAFRFSVRCSHCAPHNAPNPYGTKDLCTFQSGFNVKGGRKGYLVVASAPNQDPTPDEAKEQRRKIKNKIERGSSADMGERVLSLDLCGMSQAARDANEVLGKWMVDSYVAVDLDAADLTRELVDVGGLVGELEGAGVRFKWYTDVESPLLG